MRDSNTSSQLETETEKTAKTFANIFRTKRKKEALAQYRGLTPEGKPYIKKNVPYSLYLKSARIQF